MSNERFFEKRFFKYLHRLNGNEATMKYLVDHYVNKVHVSGNLFLINTSFSFNLKKNWLLNSKGAWCYRLGFQAHTNMKLTNPAPCVEELHNGGWMHINILL